MTVEDEGPSTTTPASTTILQNLVDCGRIWKITIQKTKGDSRPHYHRILLPPMSTSRQIYPNGCPEGEQKKCTIPLQWQDITFWKHARVIPPGTSLQTLLEADGVTMNLANQKNGKKNAKLYHTHSGYNDFSPTKALARLVHEIQDLHESTNLATYQDAGQAYQVTNKDIILTVRHGAIPRGRPGLPSHKQRHHPNGAARCHPG
jgi:hypothetical protein